MTTTNLRSARAAMPQCHTVKKYLFYWEKLAIQAEKFRSTYELTSIDKFLIPVYGKDRDEGGKEDYFCFQ